MTTSTSLYSDIEASTEVMSASPHKLIQLLLDKCLQRMQLAKTHIKNDNRKGRNESLTKANNILIHLRECLNMNDKETKEFSTQLNSTYVLAQKFLLRATLENNDELLDISINMISDVKSGWDQITK